MASGDNRDSSIRILPSRAARTAANLNLGYFEGSDEEFPDEIDGKK